jgi:pyruvate ferredoxin oxidoreductase gamma subunit
MYRIRFHGRGGQGMKTASRILGTAFFKEGYQVQDAPRYGAERRGAPIFAYVRAAHEQIFERGIIRDPNLVVVADETLVEMPAAGVLQGISTGTVLLLHSRASADTWQTRLHLTNPIHILTPVEPDREQLAWRSLGMVCAAAAARLCGVIPWPAFAAALREELPGLAADVLEDNLAHAQQAYQQMATAQGCVADLPSVSATATAAPDWIELPFADARSAAPAIHQAMTSTAMQTGLWRTLRPVIDREHCQSCAWICSTYCPDGAIRVDAGGRPQIDYDHCKGCLVCVAQCPHHAIATVPEMESGL